MSSSLDAGSLVKLSSHTDSLRKRRLGLCPLSSPPPSPTSLLVLIICEPWWPQVSNADFCISPGEAVFIAGLHKSIKGCLGCSSGGHIPPVFSLTSPPRGPGCDQKHCYLGSLLLAKAVPHLSRPPLAARRPTPERGGGGLRSCRSLSEPRVRVRVEGAGRAARPAEA